MLSLTNSVLFKKAAPVKSIDHLPQLFLDMIVAMDEYNGVGLAAPQIGISERIFIMRRGATLNFPGHIIMCVNPSIKSRSEEMIKSHEGCLSHPGTWVDKQRHKEITAGYYDELGAFIVHRFTDQDACIFQHEMDHLGGVTIASGN